MGTHGGGVWKTVDGGVVWNPIFDQEHVASIGAIAVAPSKPEIVYVGTGDVSNVGGAVNQGKGVYKSVDAGKSWQHVGLDDTRHIGAMWVDPHNPDVVLAAALGRTFSPNAARGVCKPPDGGKTWGNGLYRSDDGGATWERSAKDPRIQGSGYFGRVFLDPKNPNIVFVAQTSLYRSDDGGRTFVSYKGAPGGDDNHALWIDPTNSDRMILASDQGATISMDRGKTWSSWYNQPTGQIYHLSADNRFPYWVYGTQQDSGSVATLSRGDYGEITFMDWDPIGGYEFGYIIADPLNPNLVYAGGPGRGLVRIDRTSRQVATISPNVSRDGDYRTAMNPPLAFSPQDSHVLYEGTQFLLETRDGGVHWKAISPDLTKRPGSEARNEQLKEQAAKDAEDKKPQKKEVEETVNPPDRSAVNSFSPSAVVVGEIWAGTTNGLIQFTKDNGATWQNVSPGDLSQYSLVSMLEASHFDSTVAYAAVDRHEENDFLPHIYRTRDS